MGITALRPVQGCKFTRHLLVFCWCVGLLLGILFASASREQLAPLIRSAAGCPVSVSGIFVSAFLPFLLFAYAASLPKPWLLLTVSSLKAFGFGYCAFGVYLAFGSASWLVRLLFLFSDVCLAPVLFFYLLSVIQSGSKGKVFAFCLGAVALVGALNYWMVSPFLVKLMNF